MHKEGYDMKSTSTHAHPNEWSGVERTLSSMGSSSGMIRLKAARKMYGSGSVCVCVGRKG